LHQHDAEHLVYIIAKPHPDGPSDLVPTPLELIDKIAALVPPARIHRHRHFDVLARRGRSRVIFATTPNGRSWPTAGIARAQVNDSFGRTAVLQSGRVNFR
jgi:hypothetical protein